MTRKNNKFHPSPTTKIKPYTELPTLLPRAHTKRNIITTRNTALTKSTTTHFPISISNKNKETAKPNQPNKQIHTRRLPASRCSCFRDDVEELGST